MKSDEQLGKLNYRLCQEINIDTELAALKTAKRKVKGKSDIVLLNNVYYFVTIFAIQLLLSPSIKVLFIDLSNRCVTV